MQVPIPLVLVLVPVDLALGVLVCALSSVCGVSELRSDAPLNDVDLASDELVDIVPGVLESFLLQLPLDWWELHASLLTGSFITVSWVPTFSTSITSLSREQVLTWTLIAFLVKIMVWSQKQHLKNWARSGSGTLKLAGFFGTWGFSKPAEDEVLFSAILVVKGTRVPTRWGLD